MWVEVGGGGPQPMSTHLNPLCIFYFYFYVDIKAKKKSKCGLRWVEVDHNAPQSTLYFLFLFLC